MTASARPPQLKQPLKAAAPPTALWTALRLLGGLLTVALLAYLLWNPSEEFGWLKMVFTWVLLTILADEFGGWFGYVALALGVLPLLMTTPPQQWFVVLPLVGGALFALLMVKHSGGALVLPFGAALFAGTLLAADKLGTKLDPSLTLVHSKSFQNSAFLAMLIGVGFSFVRQLVMQLLQWQRRRNAAKNTTEKVSVVTTAVEPLTEVEGQPVAPADSGPAESLTPAASLAEETQPKGAGVAATTTALRVDLNLEEPAAKEADAQSSKDQPKQS